MLTDSDLRELLSFEPGAPVLSVYLNTEPEEGTTDAARLRLRTMLKEVDQPADVESVLRYFEHNHDWSGRSVAVFSCAAKNHSETSMGLAGASCRSPAKKYRASHPSGLSTL